METLPVNVLKYLRTGVVAALGITMTLCPPSEPRAQRVSEPSVKVTGVTSRSTGKNSLVTITADGSLTRAQTWQDEEGFHVVLPKGQTALPVGSGRGVSVRRVGNSLELVVKVRPGSRVTVQPRFNNLDLAISGGGLDNEAKRSAPADLYTSSPAQAGRNATARARRSAGNIGPVASAPSKRRETTLAAAVESMLSSRPAPLASAKQRPTVASAQNKPAQPVAQPVAAAPSPAPSVVPQPVNNEAQAGAQATPESAPAAAPAESPQASEAANELAMSVTGDEQSSSPLSSTTVLLLLAGAGLIAYFVILRMQRAAQNGEDEDEKETEKKKATPAVKSTSLVKTEAAGKAESIEQPFEQSKADRRKGSDRRKRNRETGDRRKSGAGAEDSATRQPLKSDTLAPLNAGDKPERVRDMRPLPAAAPAVLFGAYRIEQEVRKLAAGEAHTVEVLASRAVDDRRAIETSLLKVVTSQDADENARRRARTALEEYGFVARQSAALLLAVEDHDRCAAAHLLGTIKSRSSLPFLLEALYDTSQVVRNEAVASLGALGLPSAIGALLDLARRHPEIPASVLGPALSACSVESLQLKWDSHEESRTFAINLDASFTGEIDRLEAPPEVERLPEWLEDETLTDALERLSDADVEARIAAAQSLSQFQVQRAVEALTAMAKNDPSSAVRSTAVTSLGVISHESVFAPVLMALADEAREVRAAAARSLSRLNFERADAYVRVIETSDEETLNAVALACVESGLATQAIDRLASDDRRQAYEAFSLLSLIVKAGQTRPILQAIENHRDIEVRVAAVRLLGLMYQPDLMRELRKLAMRGGLPEKVRMAILETASRADQSLMEAV